MLFRDPFIVNEPDLSSEYPHKPFQFDFEDACQQDPKTDISSILRRASTQIDLTKHLRPLEIDFDLETVTDSEPGSPVAPAPIRILMLHGYTQSGDFFNSKTRKIRERITAELALADDSEIEFLYPDAPHTLESSEVPGSQFRKMSTAPQLHGWFNINDQPFTGLEQSLGYIIEYMRNVGHIDGVVGFSQGGALAMMIASLCEGKTNPERLAALANQPISINFEPPQGPMKFAISMSGFRGTTDHYEGFYNPIIATPALCIVADLDIMVESYVSNKLIESCSDAQVVHHKGGHYVPTDKKSLNAAAEFIRDRMSKSPLPGN